VDGGGKKKNARGNGGGKSLLLGGGGRGPQQKVASVSELCCFAGVMMESGGHLEQHRPTAPGVEVGENESFGGKNGSRGDRGCRGDGWPDGGEGAGGNVRIGRQFLP